jgi:hypothetical protein
VIARGAATFEYDIGHRLLDSQPFCRGLFEAEKSNEAGLISMTDKELLEKWRLINYVPKRVGSNPCLPANPAPELAESTVDPAVAAGELTIAIRFGAWPHYSDSTIAGILKLPHRAASRPEDAG